MTSTFLKDPDAVLNYGRDWSEWLDAGETIATSTWTVPAGLTKASESHTTDTATVWLSGGTDGSNYTCTNRVTTSAGRTDDRSIQIWCRSR